jgi:ribosomal protein S27AE
MWKKYLKKRGLIQAGRMMNRMRRRDRMIGLRDVEGYSLFYRSLRWRRIVCPKCGNERFENFRFKFEAYRERMRIYCRKCHSTTTINLKHSDYTSPLSHFKS